MSLFALIAAIVVPIVEFRWKKFPLLNLNNNKYAFQSKAHLLFANGKSNIYNMTLE